MSQLTTTPESEFRELDAVVKKNLHAAQDFYLAFKEIHDRKLYLEGGFKTWKKYCEERRISQSHSFRLVSAGRVKENLAQSGMSNQIVQAIPEKSLREVAKVKPEMQAEVATIAVEKAASEGRSPKLSDFSNAVQEAKTETTQAKPKVMPRDADQPEDYTDEEGYPVPEEFWPVWRDRPEFNKIAEDLRSCGAVEISHRLAALGRKHNSPACIRVAAVIQKQAQGLVDLAMSAIPSRVQDNGGSFDWLTRGEVEGNDW